MRGNNFVQRAATEAAAENAVDGRDAERQRSTAGGGEAGSRFGCAKLPTQPIEGGRHPG
jgi:hypothetical protein